MEFQQLRAAARRSENVCLRLEEKLGKEEGEERRNRAKYLLRPKSIIFNSESWDVEEKRKFSSFRSLEERKYW